MTDSDKINDLRQNQKTLITIPVDTASFNDMVDVRLTKARVYIESIRSAHNAPRQNYLRVNISHQGSEIIVDRSETQQSFLHPRTSYDFIYDVNTPSNIQADADIGTVNVDIAGGPSKVFGLVGPFCTWGIDMTNNVLNNFDFSKICAIRFEFSGLEYAPLTQSSTATSIDAN